MKYTKTQEKIKRLRKNNDGLRMVLPTPKEYAQLPQKEKRFFQGKIRKLENINKGRWNNAAKKVKKVGVFKELEKSDYVIRTGKRAGLNNLYDTNQLVMQKQNEYFINKYKDKQEDSWEQNKKIETYVDFRRHKLGFAVRDDMIEDIDLYNIAFSKNGIDYEKVNNSELSNLLNALDFYKPMENEEGYIDTHAQGEQSAHKFSDMGEEGEKVKAILKKAGLMNG